MLASGKSTAPSLPEFLRLCRALNDENDAPAQPTPLLSHDDGFRGDDWDIRSNLLLLAYIRRKPNIAEAWGNPSLGESTAILVKHKKAWAALMRSWGVNRETDEIEIPSAADQNAAWRGAMETAEAEIAAIQARFAA